METETDIQTKSTEILDCRTCLVRSMCRTKMHNQFKENPTWYWKQVIYEYYLTTDEGCKCFAEMPYLEIAEIFDLGPYINEDLRNEIM